MPESTSRADVVRVIDLFLPPGARAPEDTRRLRFLIGAAELGLGVAVLSSGAQLAFGPALPAVAIALFGAGLAVILGLVKAGVGLDTLRPLTLCLLADREQQARRPVVIFAPATTVLFSSDTVPEIWPCWPAASAKHASKDANQTRKVI